MPAKFTAWSAPVGRRSLPATWSFAYRCPWKKHSSEEKVMWEDKLLECQIRGWRAASSAGLHGKGSPGRSVFFTDTGICSRWNQGSWILSLWSESAWSALLCIALRCSALLFSALLCSVLLRIALHCSCSDAALTLSWRCGEPGARGGLPSKAALLLRRPGCGQMGSALMGPLRK